MVWRTKDAEGLKTKFEPRAAFACGLGRGAVRPIAVAHSFTNHNLEAESVQRG